MIITRSPLRISLGGGGTDLPSYYEEHGGFLVAATNLVTTTNLVTAAGWILGEEGRVVVGVLLAVLKKGQEL